MNIKTKTATEIESEVGINRNTLKTWADLGYIKRIRLSKVNVRYDVPSIEAYLNDGIKYSEVKSDESDNSTT